MDFLKISMGRSVLLRNVWKHIKGLNRTNILLIVLPLLCGAVLLAYMWNLTRQELDEYGNLTTQYFESEVNSMLDEVETACDYLLRDSDILDCVQAGSRDEIDQTVLMESIRKYAEQSDYIRDIYVCDPNHGYIYSGEAVWAYASRFSLIKSTDSVFEPEEADGDGWHFATADDTDPYYVKKLYLSDGREDVYVVATMKLSPMLRFMHSVEAQLCALYSEDGVITPLILNDTVVDWSSEADISELLGVDVKCFYKHGTSYSYVVAVAKEEYNEPLTMILTVFGGYFLLVVAAGLIYLYIASWKERKQLKALADFLPSGCAENPSLKEMLVSVKQSLRQYETASNKYQEELKSQSVRQILKSTSRTLHTEKFLAAEIPVDAKGYCVATVAVDDYADMFFDEGDELQNADLARYIFQSVFGELSEGRIATCGAGLGRNFACVFAVQDQDDPMDLITSIVHDLVDFVEKNYGLNLCAAISNIVADPCDISAAYQETERLIEFVHSVGIKVSIISAQSMTLSTEESKDTGFIRQLQLLINTLDAEKYALVPMQTSNILTQCVSGLRRYYHIAQSRIAVIAGVLSEAVLICGVSEIDPVMTAQQFQEARSASELSALTEKVFSELVRYSEAASDNGPVGRACAFIAENSTDPNLSIPAISEYAGVTTQHLTRLFHKKYGTTVAEYLHSQRIKKGKQLLAETDLLIAEIAAQVGYNSASTFTYNFRRFEGISPTNFREIIARRGSAPEETAPAPNEDADADGD